MERVVRVCAAVIRTRFVTQILETVFVNLATEGDTVTEVCKKTLSVNQKDYIKVIRLDYGNGKMTYN